MLLGKKERKKNQKEKFVYLFWKSTRNRNRSIKKTIKLIQKSDGKDFHYAQSMLNIEPTISEDKSI